METTQEAPPPVRLRTGVPQGFEDIDTPLSTQFDVTFQGRAVGSFAGTYQNGRFAFDDPNAVAQSLGDSVDAEAARAFLSQPLAANEQFRCRPGQAASPGCGSLPSGLSGIIVDVDSFTISLFLPREALVSRIFAPRELDEPYDGFSLIQNVQMSAASTGGSGDISYGGTFTTLASVGRNALIGRTTLTDAAGFRSEELYVQRIWGERRAAAGLLQDYQSLTLNSYRIYGAEFGSFYGAFVDARNDTATPIEVLLPRRAQIEIYRYGVLVSTGQYEAGLQLLDTRSLPDGTYSVQIIARDGPQILLEQTRTFSRLSGGLPMGKTGFRLRAGERVEDYLFGDILTGASERGSFLPARTGELVLAGSVQRRLTASIGTNLALSSFDSRIFGEGSIELTRGRLSGVVGAGAGSGGAYSALISGNAQFDRFSVFVTARRMRVGDDEPFDLRRLNRRYRPFFSDQDNVFGSVQVQAFGGALGVSGSYSTSQGLPDRYTAAVQYTRSLRLPVVGNALLTAGASRSDFDTRIGFSLSFFQRVDRKTNASFNVGAQHLSQSELADTRGGLSPLLDARLTRYEEIGEVDLVGEIGASTDADAERAAARILAASRFGSADLSAQWQSRSIGGSRMSFQGNAETGFAIGGGAVKVGLRNPAEAMVLVDLTRAPAVRSMPAEPDVAVEGAASGEGDAPSADASPANPTSRSARVAEGGYRVTIDGRPYDFVGPGTRTAIGVQPLQEYVVALRPEGAPEFDLDATQRKVTLFPGNVARVRFEAQRVVTLFGQVLDANGTPLPSARVEAEKDVAIADDRGFFTITTPAATDITIRWPSGVLCIKQAVTRMIDVDQPVLLHRFGQIRCQQRTGEQQSKSGNVELATNYVAPHGSEASPASNVRNLFADARRDLERLGEILDRPDK
ncbi:TcfC E-set like domain-containing protein [Sphingomonas aestuarii]